MAILTSGYGTGLTPKQKKALGFVLNPSISDSRDGKSTLNDIEAIIAGDGADNAVPLSLDVTTSFVTTAGSRTHVSLADGILGQVKRIVHSNILGGNALVITPTNLATLQADGSAGTTITSNLQKRSVTLMYDGGNWQIIAGEITGTAEMVIE